MSLTHAAIAIAVVSCGVGTADPVVLAVAGLSSQLPDVDTTKSYTGLVLYPIAKWIEERYAHRTITHRFIASTIVAAIGLPAFFWLDLNYYLAIVLGYTMGWFSDVFTKTGVAAFYPKTSRLVIPGNPNARLRTGSSAEYWLLAVAIAIVMISCNLISNGGFTEIFERTFFKGADTASDVFKKYGSDQQVFVKVWGTNTATSEKIEGKEFKVISAGGENFVIAKDERGDLFQIGKTEQSQIRPSSVETRLGERITIQAIEVEPKEQLVSELLQGIPENAYISGTLLVDNAESLRLPLEQKKFNVFKLTGGQIELSNAQKQNLETILVSFVLNGKLIIKVRSDEPIRQSTRAIGSGDRSENDR